ncbi:metallophosphoesterase [Chondromyces apiculatus]|uniref:TIR domain-containing protein n=1 Tax=Chondromyces apiculatus DSM 436 TaxID=1192034 RepID=A0A017T471_9BACT|nr:metallophosphoesterase [Chondromyces apiculatus]EYF03812.1 Hypothetical protein CAP_5242 [Chondromyces apiculatus DSM 436]
MGVTPAQVFLSHSPSDERLAFNLRKHLAPLERSGVVELWHDGMMRAGEDWRAVHRHHLEAAQMILLLVSPDFLASDRTWEDVNLALAQRDSGRTQVVPILLRDCTWMDTPLSRLQVLPRDGRPVSRVRDEDAAWSEIVQEIQTLLRFRAERNEPPRAVFEPRAERHQPVHSAVNPSAARDDSLRPVTRPSVILPIGDIFRTVGQPEITYVEPAQLPRLRAYLQVMGQGLVVEGPSGVGKTTLVKKALREVQAAEQEWLLGQRESDREKLDARLSAGFCGHLIIDDFHRLDRARQARVADAMKIIADTDARDAKITVIGINPVGESLVSALSDLTGRFESIAMGMQPPEKIDALVRKGEEAANIAFLQRAEFIVAAAGSFFTAQQLCYEAALKSGIERTAPQLTDVDVGFRDVIDTVIKTLDSRYFSALRAFACHDEKVPPRGASLALLWLLSQSSEGHVALDDVHYRFADPDVRSALALLKSSYLSRCFEAAPELKSLLYYNSTAGVISIEDPRLAFYLRHMSWPGFIKRTGHQNVRLGEETLVFSKRQPSERPQAAQRVVHVLHLSDLHFSQVSQAHVWCSQLTEDLRELECERVDVLVLSGDLTQRADAKEFQAAQLFLKALSTAMHISPQQVVVVPGNHDVSWPLSKASYTLHRRDDLDVPLEEGRFIAHGQEVVELRDEAAYPRRLETFAAFYEQIKGSTYPLEYGSQIDVQDFPRENLLILGLNSAWETDHHFRSRASIHPEALASALARVRQNPAHASRFKIAVWHHPIAGPDEDRIKDHGFMQQLAKAGFRLVLHGHIHKAERGLFRHDMTEEGRRIDLVAAGTFGAPSREWVPGYPLQYNLLRVSEDRVVVETRRREEPNGAWQPDARWLQGAGKDPLPRYTIPV